MERPSPWYRRPLDAVGDRDGTPARIALGTAGRRPRIPPVLAIHAGFPATLRRRGSMRIRALARDVRPHQAGGESDGAG